MIEKITPINLGFVNVYLIKTDQGFALIDTGMGDQRKILTRVLGDQGARPGNLALILITHADQDHIGNATYLRKLYGAKIAMHPVEAAWVSSGGATRNRKPRPDKVSPLFRAAISLGKFMPGLGQPQRFEPDLTVGEGFDLSPYGLDATVVYIPGHSHGSIGVLTAKGELFCGDLLTNNRRVATPIIDDMGEYQASMERLKGMDLRVIFPGHGKPILPDQI